MLALVTAWRLGNPAGCGALPTSSARMVSPRRGRQLGALASHGYMATFYCNCTILIPRCPGGTRWSGLYAAGWRAADDDGWTEHGDLTMPR
jgi:hypothetical protein